jgi:uncharacterized protein YkwD
MSSRSRSRIAKALLLFVAILTLHPCFVNEPCAESVRFPADPSREPHPPDASPALEDQGREGLRLLQMINETRWEQGQIPPLKANPHLQRAAQEHSLSMAESGFFGHKGCDGSSPWDRIEASGYGNWHVLAENVAAGYADPQDTLRAWLESPRHRANLLNPELCEAGVGYVVRLGDTYPGETWGFEHYWTLDLGSRWDASPLVIAGEAYSTSTPLVDVYIYGEGWAVEMRLSNDGQNWTEWQPYEPLLTWRLSPGNGPKEVHAQLRDSDGNLRESQDGILLQQPSPEE